MDNVKKGTFVTVIRGKMSGSLRQTSAGPEWVEQEEGFLKGKVLKILVIDMPYIVVEHIFDRAVRKATINLQEVKIMKISNDFVRTLHPDLEIKEEEDDPDIQEGQDILLDSQKS